MDTVLILGIAGCLAYWAFSWLTELDARTCLDLGNCANVVRMYGGEKLAVKEHVTICAHASVKLALFIGQNPTHDIAQEASAMVTRRMGIWAFRFSSAEQAMMPESYDSLEADLMAITADKFTVHSAIVIDIGRSLPNGADAEPNAEPPEETPVQKVRRKYATMGEEIDAINESFEEMGKKHPKVVNDPDLAQRLKDEIGTDKRRATFGDSYRRPIDRRRYRV